MWLKLIDRTNVTGTFTSCIAIITWCDTFLGLAQDTEKDAIFCKICQKYPIKDNISDQQGCLWIKAATHFTLTFFQIYSLFNLYNFNCTISLLCLEYYQTNIKVFRWNNYFISWWLKLISNLIVTLKLKLKWIMYFAIFSSFTHFQLTLLYLMSK